MGPACSAESQRYSAITGCRSLVARAVVTGRGRCAARARVRARARARAARAAGAGAGAARRRAAGPAEGHVSSGV